MKSTVVCHGPKPSFEIKTKRILQSNKDVWVAKYLWWSNISGLLYFKNCKYLEISFQITNHVLKSQIKFSNHKSSFQITNQVQNHFSFKSHMPNSLVTDPSRRSLVRKCTYLLHLWLALWLLIYIVDGL